MHAHPVAAERVLTALVEHAPRLRAGKRRDLGPRRPHDGPELSELALEQPHELVVVSKAEIAGRLLDMLHAAAQAATITTPA